MLKIYQALCYAKRILEVALSDKPMSHPSHHLDYEEIKIKIKQEPTF